MQESEQTTDGIFEKLVNVNRVSKVTKGGRTFGFSALVVVGDGKGKVGFAVAKAAEVPNAIKKAMSKARRKMVRVELNNATLQHPVRARHGATRVVMLPASDGTGVIAGSAMRAVFEVIGVENVLSKVIGSSNPVNVVRATIEGLADMVTPEEMAAKRGMKVKHILSSKFSKNNHVASTPAPEKVKIVEHPKKVAEQAEKPIAQEEGDKDG